MKRYAKHTITAVFYANPTYGKAPLTVHFRNASQGHYTQSTWFFGDGDDSTDTNPTHTYKKPGRYTVGLTITDENGATSDDTILNYIEVY